MAKWSMNNSSHIYISNKFYLKVKVESAWRVFLENFIFSVWRYIQNSESFYKALQIGFKMCLDPKCELSRRVYAEPSRHMNEKKSNFAWISIIWLTSPNLLKFIFFQVRDRNSPLRVRDIRKQYIIIRTILTHTLRTRLYVSKRFKILCRTFVFSKTYSISLSHPSITHISTII